MAIKTAFRPTTTTVAVPAYSVEEIVQFTGIIMKRQSAAHGPAYQNMMYQYMTLDHTTDSIRALMQKAVNICRNHIGYDDPFFLQLCDMVGIYFYGANYHGTILFDPIIEEYVIVPLDQKMYTDPDKSEYPVEMFGELRVATRKSDGKKLIMVN